MKRFFILGVSFFAIILLGCAHSARGDRFFPSGDAGIHRTVDTGISTDYVYFDSRDPFCKSPYGAVEQGASVTLRIATRKGQLQSVELVLETQTIYDTFAKSVRYREHKSLPMEKVYSTNAYDVWEAEFSLDEIGVYGYHFNLKRNDRDIVTYADNQNTVNVPGVMVRGLGGIGMFTAYGRNKNPYQLTVYSKDMKMPEWTRDMVIYYIFPERFKNGNKANDPVVGKTKFYGNRDIQIHKNWCDPKPWVPGDGFSDDQWCNDFYGGDIDGVIQKLDYIRSLGANVIYLNPIFFAPSNHKYDTADYHKIDPHFGDLRTFQRLVSEAKKRGIRIILDASLNHCGSDSIYMDRFGKYPTLGAFENQTITPESPYYEWFKFDTRQTDPSRMFSSWLGFDSLADINDKVESYRDFAYRNKDSVTKYWLQQGAYGWRMDVTPWVSDDFWREWYSEIKKDYPDTFTIAEVWFDASKYLVGDMFDSTMNYIFRQALLDFAKGGNASKSVDALEMVRENYPKPVFYRLMNLMSTHDQPRTLWEVGYKEVGQRNYNEIYRKRLILTKAFQFTYPGIPTIYYGDEVGMTGGHDPYNRGPYPWKEDGCTPPDETLIPVVQNFARIRSENQVFIDGEIRMLYSDRNIILFERSNDSDKAIVVFNNGKEDVSFVIPSVDDGVYVDLEGGGEIALNSGESFTMPPYAYKILLKR